MRNFTDDSIPRELKATATQHADFPPAGCEHMLLDGRQLVRITTSFCLPLCTDLLFCLQNFFKPYWLICQLLPEKASPFLATANIPGCF